MYINQNILKFSCVRSAYRTVNHFSLKISDMLKFNLSEKQLHSPRLGGSITYYRLFLQILNSQG